MSTRESTLMGVSTFVSIALVTFLVVTAGMWVAKQPAGKKSASRNSSAAHWMFWAMGRDLDDELRNPKSVFDPGPAVVPAWDSGQVGDFNRYLREEQEKRDRLMEDIRSQWGSP